MLYLVYLLLDEYHISLFICSLGDGNFVVVFVNEINR